MSPNRPGLGTDTTRPEPGGAARSPTDRTRRVLLVSESLQAAELQALVGAEEITVKACHPAEATAIAAGFGPCLTLIDGDMPSLAQDNLFR